jgi:hypothetical protein
MSFFYIETDGKTVTEFSGSLEFTKDKGADVNKEPHVNRMFAVHPDQNSYIHVDHQTGRYVYRYCGKEIRF